MHKYSNTVIIIAGPSGSGKTTYAASLLAARPDLALISPDNYRLELTGDTSNQSRNHFIFTQLLPARINEAYINGKGCLVDATSVSRQSRKALIECAKVMGYSRIECHVIQADEAECQARNAARDRVVPASVISKQFAQWQEPELAEGFDEIVKIDNRS